MSGSGAGLGGALVRDERAIPEPIEVVPQRVDAGGIELIEAAVSLGPIDDEVRVFQNPEMLRDGGPADREIAGEFADWLRAIHQALENRPPGGIAQRIKLPGMLVSNH
jgi:hypothetical protein